MKHNYLKQSAFDMKKSLRMLKHQTLDCKAINIFYF